VVEGGLGLAGEEQEICVLDRRDVAHVQDPGPTGVHGDAPTRQTKEVAVFGLLGHLHGASRKAAPRLVEGDGLLAHQEAVRGTRGRGAPEMYPQAALGPRIREKGPVPGHLHLPLVGGDAGVGRIHGVVGLEKAPA